MEDETERENYFDRQKKPWQWTWRTTIGRSVMPAFICGLLVLIVPKFESMFAELGIALPGATILLLNLGHFLRAYFLAIPVFVVLAVALDYGGYLLFRQCFGDGVAHLWMGFVVLCYLVYVGFFVLALFLPLMTLSTKVTPAPTPASKPGGAPSGILHLFR